MATEGGLVELPNPTSSGPPDLPGGRDALEFDSRAAMSRCSNAPATSGSPIDIRGDATDAGLIGTTREHWYLVPVA